MGGPNPGIVANFVVEKIERDALTFRVPRYCAINSDGSLYFVSGQKYVAHMMDEDSEGNTDGVDIALVPEIVTDLGTEYDLVRVTSKLLDYHDLPNWFTENRQYGALFIARYPVPPEP